MVQRSKVRRTTRKETPPRLINLALQGGGSHGAFSWGVLDRLLMDERIVFEGVSATSAGAMNAVVLAYGWSLGGREGARAALAAFWRDVSDTARQCNPFATQPWDVMGQLFGREHSPVQFWMDSAMRMFSPYQLNPFNFNPLRDLLERHVDFAALRHSSPIRLFLCATNVESGKVRIFEHHELSPDVVLASACLPFLFQAVEIDGEFFWDGGYMGNPAIFPLIYQCQSADVVIVHVNPIERKGCPTTAGEILSRLNEISFNSSLMREMRAIAFVSNLIERGKVAQNEMKAMRIHSIRSDATMAQFGVASKMDTSWPLLQKLQSSGSELAQQWLVDHFSALGVRSSVDFNREFL